MEKTGQTKLTAHLKQFVEEVEEADGKLTLQQTAFSLLKGSQGGILKSWNVGDERSV